MYSWTRFEGTPHSIEQAYALTTMTRDGCYLTFRMRREHVILQADVVGVPRQERRVYVYNSDVIFGMGNAVQSEAVAHVATQFDTFRLLGERHKCTAQRLCEAIAKIEVHMKTNGIELPRISRPDLAFAV